MSRSKSILLVFGPACLWIIAASIGFYLYSAGESAEIPQIGPTAVMAEVQSPEVSEGFFKKLQSGVGEWLTGFARKLSPEDKDDETLRKLVEENLRLQNEALKREEIMENRRQIQERAEHSRELFRQGQERQRLNRLR